MARKNRSQEIIEHEVNTYHITDRCVRRAFLCGKDSATRKSFDYRRQWLHDRLAKLIGYFLVDVVGFSMMGNHMHVILRNRPDLVADMSDEQVIRAWWEISPQYRRDSKTGNLTSKRLKKLLKDSKHIKNCRARLSSISWFMRYLKHPMALMANTEGKQTGHFWEARFRSKPIRSLDQLLNAMIYVDLNPIRAGMALTLEDSLYTSAYDRIESSKRRRRLGHKPSSPQAHKRLDERTKRDQVLQTTDEWLSPIYLDESPGPAPPPSAPTNDATKDGAGGRYPRRSPDRGILPISEEKYLMLVDLVGRVERTGKRGKIPKGVPPLLEQLGLGTPTEWLTAYLEYSYRQSLTYRCKVNTSAEAILVDIPLVNPTKTNQDGFL